MITKNMLLDSEAAGINRRFDMECSAPFSSCSRMCGRACTIVRSRRCKQFSVGVHAHAQAIAALQRIRSTKSVRTGPDGLCH